MTDSNICVDEIRSKIDIAGDVIIGQARKLKPMNLANTEILIKVENLDDVPRYYLIDHQRRTEFWLTDDQSDSDDLAFKNVYSEAHMSSSLMFWYRVLTA